MAVLWLTTAFATMVLWTAIAAVRDMGNPADDHTRTADHGGLNAPMR
ncbi:hypothetical protein [Streptomyces sp. NPDC059819]